MLKINRLTAEREGEKILNNISLNVDIGKKSLLMGPNGSGKTSLARVVMGDSAYKVVSGSIELMKNSEITDMLPLEAHERARMGLFVSFQVPVALPGVSAYELLYTAYREIHEKAVDNEKKGDN